MAKYRLTTEVNAPIYRHYEIEADSPTEAEAQFDDMSAEQRTLVLIGESQGDEDGEEQVLDVWLD
jgi:hypothetical protein